MTTISVVTPTFRREDLLRRCVENVLAQRVEAEIQHPSR
ncbi:MAG: glycosyltransferase [Armatimonadetes bacterium]|nr:glycosyltransferase [Armatimonadota bacterium]